MTLTILFDLDDTLLIGSTEKILPAYLSKFSAHLSQITDRPEKIVPAMMAATELMLHNTDPTKTLKEVFDADFYPAMGWDYQAPQALIEEFYSNHYPKLEQMTSPNPAGLELVKKLQARGDQIVIATNPIFPMIAVDQRLDWANLSAEKHAFSLVTNYEESHFTKPNPAYYTEILGKIGWPENPMVMVGDNKAWDIDPAQELGIATYWVDGDIGYTHEEARAPYHAGPLGGLLTWLDSIPEEQLIPDFSSPISSTAIMRSIPAVLSSFLGDVSPADWHTPLSKDGWNLTEIICHLRDVDREIYIPRLNQVKENERPFIEAIDADSWAEERNYKQQDGKQAFVDFTSARIKLLELINSFDSHSWQKEIRHTIFGPLSLAELLKISARHDKLHIQYIYEILTPLKRN
ncbi:MAG: DinB family protein [Chloroflexota bacterium]